MLLHWAEFSGSHCLSHEINTLVELFLIVDFDKNASFFPQFDFLSNLELNFCFFTLIASTEAILLISLLDLGVGGWVIRF
jgi:hypothetical protein